MSELTAQQEVESSCATANACRDWRLTPVVITTIDARIRVCVYAALGVSECRLDSSRDVCANGVHVSVH